jgi:predicted transglutaminase-like protease
LLKNKLGVCRDYAKLTACLLSNIYRDKEIYFASTSTHVATGIMFEELYFLDQHLPVLTVNKWHILNPSKRKIQILKKGTLKSENINSYLSHNDFPPLDTKKLEKKITALLSIKIQTTEDDSSVKIRRKKGAILYEDDEIVTYSFAQWLKMKISDEVLDLSQITNLEIVQEKEDLVFDISFKSKQPNLLSPD